MPKRVILFAVDDTLLDLRALAPHFERVFGDDAALNEWLAQVLQSALLSVATGPHSDFAKVERAALDIVAARRRALLSDVDARSILGGVRTLPPHADVLPALARLQQAGFRLGALTNARAAVAEAQLANSGIAPYLDKIVSIDVVRRLKPAAEVYRHAADSFGVAPAEIRLVAAHAWDLVGAMRAGCKAAFVARPGMVLDPLFEPPDVLGQDLRAVAERIIGVDVRSPSPLPL